MVSPVAEGVAGGMDANPWQQYRSAVVRIDTPSGPVSVRPQPLGETDGLFPELSGLTVYVITAYNPAGETVSDDDNRRAHVRLLDEVHDADWTYWQAAGGDPDWTHVEPSIAVVGAPEVAVLRLARSLGQDAVFAWTPSAWWLVSADGRHREELGWTIARDEDADSVADAFTQFDLPHGSFNDAFVDGRTGHWIARCEPAELQRLRAASAAVHSWVEHHAASLARDKRAVADQRRAVREATRERRRVARDRQREQAELQRQAYEAEGWSALWSLTDVRSLLEHGCTPHSVEPFVTHGWEPQEILNAARRGVLGDGVVPPEGDAAFHRSMGDGLVGLLGGLWPSCPPDTVISVKRSWSTGRAERWLFRSTEAGSVVERRRRTNTGWQAPSVAAAEGMPLDALRARPALCRLTRDVAHRYSANESIDSSAIAGLLRVDADGGDVEYASWPRNVARAWDGLDDALDDAADRLPRILRRASVDGLPVACLRAGRRLLPVLVDPDIESNPSQGDLALAGARPLASYSWFSESGGAPVSWDGGSGLWSLNDAAVLAQSWGDIDAERQLVAMPATVAGVADLLATWVQQNAAIVTAAIALEPFDPRGTLSSDDKELWEERFEALTASMQFAVSEDVRRALRSRLARRHEEYRDARRALASPGGAQGQRLAASLDDVLETGVLGQGM